VARLHSDSYERLTARVGGSTAAERESAAHLCAADVPPLLAVVDAQAAEIAQLRDENTTMTRLTAELMTGDTVTPDEAVEVVRRALAPTCVCCGQPVADQAARCEPPCQPRLDNGGAQ
jgi:hypothetical protein